jgi:hypothetical protein
VGRYTSIALGAQGKPHVSYHDGTTGDLKYAVGNIGTGVLQTLAGSPSLTVFPNPVIGGEANVLYNVSAGTPVDLALFDASGRRVSTIVSETAGPRAGNATWTGLDAASRPLAPGVYFLRLVAGDQVETRRVTVIR